MNPWLVLLAVVALALGFVAVPVAAFRHWWRAWRLICPRAGTLAQIRVDAARAAGAELVGRPPDIDRCSLWPALLGCRQECLALPVGARWPMRRGEAPPRERGDGAIRLIVVPLDGTPGSEAARPAGPGRARGCGARLRLLRVVPSVKEVRTEEDRVVVWADQETTRVEYETLAYLGRLAAGFQDVAVESAVRIGDVTTEIVEESEAAGADLIALATDRRRGLGRGRELRRLRRATTIPLLVVPSTNAAA
jgi:nucleotide-binding universal stress UspA family protein